MIDAAWGLVSSIAWGWTAAGLGLAGLAALAFYTGRIQAGVAFAVGAVCVLGTAALLTQRDAAREDAKAARKEAAASDLARDVCLTNLDGWMAKVSEQNQAVENLRKESARRLAVAAKAAAKREAEAEARGRSAGALAALSARPAADGDESCDAADREIVRRLGP